MTTEGFWDGFFKIPNDIVYAFQHINANELAYESGMIVCLVIIAFVVAIALVLAFVVIAWLLGGDK